MSAVDIQIQRKCYPAQAGAPPHVAIEDLRIQLAAHEFVCLVGPSGCGKTTLLNIVAGLDALYDGHIHIEHPAERAARIACVFQEPRLLPWRTVRQNIELALPPGCDSDIDALLTLLGLADSAAVYPQRLSLGMSRRVAIARAFAVQPDLLLLDEPFVSLDAATAQRVRQLLLTCWDQRPHTVLFVTHDLREAIALADRLILLSSAPTQVAAHVSVTLSRQQRQQESAVAAFRQTVLEQHPGLLGRLSADNLSDLQRF